MLKDLEALTPAVAKRAAEFDAHRTIPRDLVETLRSIGIFRLFVPRGYGGLELDMPCAIEILTTLAKIDGSLGWIGMIGAGAALVIPELPKGTYERIYEHGPDVIFAGSFLPGGTAERTEQGWRVSGRWPFASGCLHADWILGLCTMREHGVALPGPADGVPLMRGFLAPATEWHVEDSWHVMGLRGTGSHHISLSDAWVDDDQFFASGAQPWLTGPLYGAAQQFIPLLHAANNVGIAEGALEDLVAFAANGHRQQRASAPMRDSEYFQAELGRAYADVRAARAFLRDQTANYWQRAVAGKLNDKDLQILGAQTTTWIAATCARATDVCFELAGSSMLYENMPLQRRMRDLHAAAQHAALQKRNFINGGSLLLKRHPASTD
ncbi:flavin-dependent monooxygenase [Paraburkholderia sp. SOS3]|nr:flavin-dependent monooxygenase [Paraburkholderia sp. SOS3]